MADFWKVHKRQIEHWANIAASNRHQYFRIVALSPPAVFLISRHPEDSITWSVDFEVRYEQGDAIYKPTKQGRAAIEAWTEKYKTTPDDDFKFTKW